MNRALGLLALAGLVVAASARADEPPPDTGLKVGGFPIVDYNSDEGVGFGARVKLTSFGDGTVRPFLWSLELQGFASTKGIQSHYINLDMPALGGSRYRLQIGLAFGRSKYAPYYGVGNGARYDETKTSCPRETLEQVAKTGPPNSCPPMGSDPGNPNFAGYRYYNYDILSFPAFHATVFRSLSGPWSLAAGYRFVLYGFRPTYYPDTSELGQTTGSQLTADGQAGSIVGYDGHPTSPDQRIHQRYSEVSFGVRYDSRDNEFAPTRGMLHDLTLRGAAHAMGSESNVVGATANLRLYQRPIPSYWRLVFALGLVGDLASSGLPFYLLPEMGPGGPDGIGGGGSIRGLLLHRFVGDVKVLGNAELRWRFLSIGDWEVGAVGGLDAGRVWAKLGQADVGPVHFGAAAGLRIAWGHHFIIRADYGFGISEPFADGSIYLDFGELF